MNHNGDKRSVSFEGLVGTDEVIAYLESLRTALEKGTVYIRNGQDVVGLEPAPEITMEVEARSKKEKQVLKLALRWERVDDPEIDPLEAFVITDREPELPQVVIEEVEE